MKTQTYCSCSIILMIVRYIQCVNNIEGNILDISLSLSTTKKIRRKDCPAGRCAWLASLCPSIFFPPFSHRHKSRMKKETLINRPPQRQARKETWIDRPSIGNFLYPTAPASLLRPASCGTVDHGDTIISSFPFPCPNNEKEKAPSLIAADDPARLDAQRPRRVVVAPGRAVRRQDVNSSKDVVSHVFFIVLVWIDSVIAAAHSRFMFVWSNLWLVGRVSNSSEVAGAGAMR